jgi:hypothetical protein
METAMRQALFLPILLLGVTPVLAADLPQRKSGLWEFNVQNLSHEGVHALKMCVDQATDNALLQLVEMRPHETCKKVTLSREGDKQVVDAQCKLGGAGHPAKTHAVITGSFDSQYKIESTSAFKKPIHGKSERDSKIDARWTGPCGPDQKPGDLIYGNGEKVNIYEQQDPNSKPPRGLFTSPAEKAKRQITPQ